MYLIIAVPSGLPHQAMAANRFGKNSLLFNDQPEIGAMMTESLYKQITPQIAKQRRETASENFESFRDFSKQVFSDSALDAKTKQLIAVAAAHITQCPYCIESHAKLAVKAGATRQQIMEAIWVAAEMRAGAAYAHSGIALSAIDEAEDKGI